jgi:hypothetical protein
MRGDVAAGGRHERRSGGGRRPAPEGKGRPGMAGSARARAGPLAKRRGASEPAFTRANAPADLASSNVTGA